MANDLLIRISADTKAFQDELKRITTQTEDLQDALTTTAKVSGAAFVAFTGVIGLTIAAYREQEVAVNKLNATLRNNGLNVDVLSDQYQKLATKISETTLFGDEEIINAQARLQGYLGEITVTEDLTKAVTDLAAAKGIDLATAADMVGKAIGTSTNALSRQGIEVDATATRHEKMAQILDGINSKWRDQATAAAQGAGIFLLLKKEIGELAEDIGKNLVPVLAPLAAGLLEVVGWLKQHPEVAKFAAEALVVGAVISGLVTGLSLLAIGFIQVSAAMAAAGITISATTLGIRALVGATGIGLLLLLIADLALNWPVRFKQMQGVFEAFTRNISELAGGLGKILKGAFTMDMGAIKEGLAQVKEAFSQGLDDFDSVVSEKEAKNHEKRNQARKDRHNAQVMEILKENEDFQAMTDAQQAEFLVQNEAKLAEQIETEKSTRSTIALEKAQEQIKTNNQYLKEQQKFGTAYAQINKVMNSEIFQGQKQAFGELAQLQTSSNATLKGIGKTAAIANIVIKTAESAMAIYAGFSTIPIVGPALGIAGAAAAVAFGGEQISRVTSAADGGLISGGRAGRDSVPALLMPGELVVPTRNFSEVVNAVANQRSQDGGSSSSGIAGVEGAVSVAIAFDGDEAERVITARQVESRALGTLRE